MSIRFGYACINMHLQKTQKVTTNRGMIKRTFKAKGIAYASELAEHNTRNILPILMWNQKHNIKVFRMSSCLFPWASEYNLEDLPDWNQIEINLKKAGAYARHCGIRLSFHPGPFNILTSPKENVVENSIKDLAKHQQMLHMTSFLKQIWT